jgi:hypothetical protein
MNPRIQKLAQEAGLYVDVNGKPWPRNMNGEDIEGAYQKFAELIVRQCMKVASPNYMSTPEDSVYYVEQAVNRIAEHFGVEE